MAFGGADAVDGFDAAAEIFGDIFEAGVAGFGRDDGELHRRGVERGLALDVDAVDAGRKGAAGLVHLPEDVVVDFVGVDAPVEVDVEDHDAVFDDGAHLADIIEFLDGVLDGANDEAFDFHGAGARENDDDEGGGQVEERIFAARDVEKSAESEGDDTGEDDEREARVLERKGSEIHRSGRGRLSWSASPACRR